MIKMYRRDFIRTSLCGGLAAAVMPAQAMKVLAGQTEITADTRSRVSLVTGADRADMAFRALQPFADEIARAAGNKRIIIKPNLVESKIPLCASHAETLEGVLEFYKSIRKLENVVVGESSADGPTMNAYEDYNFIPVADKYKVKLIDFDHTPTQILYVVNEHDIRPKPVRVTSLLTDRNNFVMSLARMKTHGLVVATLTLKNLVFGAPVKDPGFVLYKRRNEAQGKSDKPVVHGNGFRATNYNLFAMAYHIRPDLGFIDGFTGMEGNGPTKGTPIDHRVCVAGLDWLAVERVGIELMGINPDDVGYLNYCNDAGMGQFDLNKIDITGEKITEHIKTYQLAGNFDRQMQWKITAPEKSFG